MYLRADHIVPIIHWREVRLREVKGLAIYTEQEH